MIRLEKTSVMNIENAIRGARNPMNSWGKSDSFWVQNKEMCRGCNEASCNNCPSFTFVLGNNDLDLVKRLCKAGSDHRKFLRQIFVSVDITAPLYFWKEFDTYKVGTTANSCSTMHKIHSKEFALDDFSHENIYVTDNGYIEGDDGFLWLEGLISLKNIVGTLNAYRRQFNKTKDKKYWYSMIQLLPSSYNQLRTCTMTYENLRNMYQARKNHKLDEWHVFCDWVETLPYAKELIIGE